jgi:hypothetical protein
MGLVCDVVESDEEQIHRNFFSFPEENHRQDRNISYQ